MSNWTDKVNWNEQGLVPVVVQDVASGQVLMHAWMNREALQQTYDSGKAVYWSRSRQQLWTKGESSGHFQQVESIRMDCDNDTLLLSVRQEGGIACHTGRAHCFFHKLEDEDWQTTEPVLEDPATIYKK
ncbi:MAG: phosphoribosyl-AMP cyclohydrolase [Gammaproteobacteria bacterium]